MDLTDWGMGDGKCIIHTVKMVCVLQVYINDHPQWVKVVSAVGVVSHQPWSRVYNDMKLSAGIREEG